MHLRLLLWGALHTAASVQGRRSREKVALLAARLLLLGRCKALFEPVHSLAVSVDGDSIRWPVATVAATSRSVIIDWLIVVARPRSAAISLFVGEIGRSGGLGKGLLGCQDLPEIINSDLGVSSRAVCLGVDAYMASHELREAH